MPSAYKEDQMLTIVNSGQAIAETNYWDSQYARNGLFYLSWNAGVARLLVPDNQQCALRELCSARLVMLSQGVAPIGGEREALELKFEDDSDAPYCLRLSTRQTDRPRAPIDQGGGFHLAVWTRGGLQLRLPAKFRRVRFIPSVAVWSGH